MMLGGVPIIVLMPPKIAAKARGISIRAGGRPCFRADSRATGINRARAPTLFMKADAKATKNINASR
jgi:hypothetical protein